MAFILPSRSDKTYQFFIYAIALYYIVVSIKFAAFFYAPPYTPQLPVILELAASALYVVIHAAVIFVVHYLGRKGLVTFLTAQLCLSVAVSIAIKMATTPSHFVGIFITNSVLGIVYITTLFAIRKTPFNSSFRWLAVAETVTMVVGSASIFVAPLIRNLLLLVILLPGICLLLLIQKTRRHLASAEQEASFLQDVNLNI